MAFIESMHRNKPNITYLLTLALYGLFISSWRSPWQEQEIIPAGLALMNGSDRWMMRPDALMVRFWWLDESWFRYADLALSSLDLEGRLWWLWNFFLVFEFITHYTVNQPLKRYLVVSGNITHDIPCHGPPFSAWTTPDYCSVLLWSFQCHLAPHCSVKPSPESELSFL